MNFPQPAQALQPVVQPSQSLSEETDEINLLELLDVVLDGRWLIAAVTALALVAGGSYALLSTPVFEANTLIQVEESKAGSGAAAGALGEAASLFEIRSPATAEMEILRSRLVVSEAVQNLRLDLSVVPKYLPIVGGWLARSATAPSTPGFLGMGGYVSGNESLSVGVFDIPRESEGKRFSVLITSAGYQLISPDGETLVTAGFGAKTSFLANGHNGTILIISAVAKPGAHFYLSRFSRLAVVEKLQMELGISEQGRQSGVIRTTLAGTEPSKIARTLNEIGTLYVRQNVARKGAEAEKTLTFLGTLLPQLRASIEESENKFNQFRNRNSAFDLTTEAKLVLEQSVKLQTSLLELQQKRKDLESRFTAQHPSIQTIDAQINRINSELGAVSGRVKAFPSVEQDLLRLTRDLKVNTELYASLLNSSQQLQLVKEGKVGNVRIVDTAVVPESPIKPQRLTVLALAGVLGLLAGLASAFLRNSLRPGIKDPADIEQRVGLNVFASLPHSEAQVKQSKVIKSKTPGIHVLAVVEPKDPVVESLRSLRTALQFAMLDATSNVVLITGPTPGIGKSFISVNFAAVLGAANKKVLLIDADLRKGHLNDYFGQPRARGLSELLSGGLTLSETLRRDVVPNVDFLTTGILPPNPPELLMSPRMQALMQQLASQYDLIIIDTPPVLAASDTAILAPLAGAVFMVARAEVSTLGELQESAKRLAQSGVQARGVIFNDLNISKRRYGYGVGYKYGKYRYTNYEY